MTIEEKLKITKEWADWKYRQEYPGLLAKQWRERMKQKKTNEDGNPS